METSKVSILPDNDQAVTMYVHHAIIYNDVRPKETHALKRISIQWQYDDF